MDEIIMILAIFAPFFILGVILDNLPLKKKTAKKDEAEQPSEPEVIEVDPLTMELDAFREATRQGLLLELQAQKAFNEMMKTARAYQTYTPKQPSPEDNPWYIDAEWTDVGDDFSS